MILPSVMQGNENGMLFDKTLLSSNLVLQHFSSLLADNSNDDKSNIQNGIEKINLNTCNKLTQNETTDTTTWIDLFQGHGSLECNTKITKDNISKHLNQSPLTTWADIHENVFFREDVIEDESLSVQLAALRLQLEEKRRKFNEEKIRKQEEWREQRAQMLQDAFFHMLNTDKSNDFWFTSNNEDKKSVHIEPNNENHSFNEGNQLFQEDQDDENIPEYQLTIDEGSFDNMSNDEIATKEAMKNYTNPLSPLIQAFSPFSEQKTLLNSLNDYSASFQHNNQELSNCLNEIQSTSLLDHDESKYNYENTEEISAFRTPVKSNQSNEIFWGTHKETNIYFVKDDLPRHEVYIPQDTVQMDGENDISLLISDVEDLSPALHAVNVVDMVKKDDSKPPPSVVTPSSSAMTFVIGMEQEENSASELTPQQIKKRERFMRQRQKNIEEEKKKSAAEFEKKQMEKAENDAKKALKSTPKAPPLKKLHTKLLTPELSSPRKAAPPPRTATPTRNSPSPKTVSSPRNNPSQQRGMLANELTSLVSCDSPAPGTHPDEPSRYAEYKGPEAYKKPTCRSNRKLMENAIMHYCLCGEVNKDAKKKCLVALEKSTAKHFVVLFREGLKFRSVYEFDPESEIATRLYGIGPKEITEKMVNTFFKYNSGGKEFSLLETKHLSIQVDGMIMISSYWRKIKQNDKK